MAMARKKEVNWVKDYSSSHPILLVGEGDFFSSCLICTFGSAYNICTSSLDLYGNGCALFIYTSLLMLDGHMHVHL